MSDSHNSPNDPPRGDEFYRVAIQTLRHAKVPFLVGGAYALRSYAGILRDTKDFDIFLKEADIERAMRAFAQAGFMSAWTFPHWLAKVCCGGDCIDMIYRAGNGLCRVTNSWFERSQPGEILGERISLCAPEEIIWMKSYIQERERFDGADIAHVLRGRADLIDWPHLLAQFGPDWRVLLSHLILFGFIYPAERARIPPQIMDELLERLRRENASAPVLEKWCNGTLLSRAQYLPDIGQWGYQDARLHPRAEMNARDIENWTAQVDEKDRPQ